MITLQTTAVCPAGLAAAVALEHLGEAYEVEVVPEGYFIETYGVKGPRLTGETLSSLLERCVGSAATRHVLDHVLTRVVPKLVAKETPRDELLALDALIAVVPRADQPKLVPILATLVRTGRFPDIERSDAFDAPKAGDARPARTDRRCK